MISFLILFLFVFKQKTEGIRNTEIFVLLLTCFSSFWLALFRNSPLSDLRRRSNMIHIRKTYTDKESAPCDKKRTRKRVEMNQDGGGVVTHADHRQDQLTANIKLTMMSMYLAHFMPELSCNSRFAILQFVFSLARRLQCRCKCKLLITGTFRNIEYILYSIWGIIVRVNRSRPLTAVNVL